MRTELFSFLKMLLVLIGYPGLAGPEGPRGESGAPGFGLPGERGDDGMPGYVVWYFVCIIHLKCFDAFAFFNKQLFKVFHAIMQSIQFKHYLPNLCFNNADSQERKDKREKEVSREISVFLEIQETEDQVTIEYFVKIHLLSLTLISYLLGLPGRPGITGAKGDGGRPGQPGMKGDLGEKGS